MSRPTRARGLKLIIHPNATKAIVAPHAGAWIETCGIKPSLTNFVVAPHAGAWIETFINDDKLYLSLVAPHAGAWIETIWRATSRRSLTSRPTRARGLKLFLDLIIEKS